jgi:hypothetical protein
MWENYTKPKEVGNLNYPNYKKMGNSDYPKAKKVGNLHYPFLIKVGNWDYPNWGINGELRLPWTAMNSQLFRNKMPAIHNSLINISE